MAAQACRSEASACCYSSVRTGALEAADAGRCSLYILKEIRAMEDRPRSLKED
jgi:hypothetical protein